jgi:hypothetical protein
MAALERYLEQHPEAADSAPGVAQWWLPSVGVELPEAVVQQALEVLEARGQVLRTTLQGGQVIWRLRR